MSIKWIKETFCKKKELWHKSFPLISFKQCLTQAAHMAALTLVSDKRALMLFFPLMVFPNLVIHDIDMSTSTLLVIKQSKQNLCTHNIYIYALTIYFIPTMSQSIVLDTEDKTEVKHAGLCKFQASYNRVWPILWTWGAQGAKGARGKVPRLDCAEERREREVTLSGGQQ